MRVLAQPLLPLLDEGSWGGKNLRLHFRPCLPVCVPIAESHRQKFVNSAVGEKVPTLRFLEKER